MRTVEAIVLISVTIALVSAGGPPGSLDATKVSVRKGGDVVLRCEVSQFVQNGQLPPYVIQWFRDKVPVYIKVGKHPPHINGAVEALETLFQSLNERLELDPGRLSIAEDLRSNASLKITNVTLSDEGWYQCQILFLRDTFEKSTNGTWIKLAVTDPPSFIERPPLTKIARLGQSLLLKCRATGRPQPVITWRKDGRLVRDGEDEILLSGGKLVVTSLTTSHRGKYSCLAQSVEGQIRVTTDVKVEAPPEFERRPSDLTTQEGRDALFECRATGYPSIMKYRWTYNADPVEVSDHLRGRYSVLADGSLIIYNIKTSDRGNVSCTVENDFGHTPTAKAALFVQFSARVSHMPAIVYAGRGLKAVLRCPSEAEPPVNKVIWKKDNNRISAHQGSRASMDGDGSLVINSVDSGDAGQYRCTPYNIHGTRGESTATELRIRPPPFFVLTPNPTYEAELGKSINIPCRGGGDPPPAVTWRKVHRTDEAFHSKIDYGSLTIRPVTKAIHGTWQCVLTNSVAEVTKDVEIYVKYTTPHKVKNISAQALSDSAIRVEWTPGYDGGYPQSFIVWYRQAGMIDPSWQTHDVEQSHTVAVLRRLQPDTKYEVAVLPENKIRSGSFSDTVTVKTRVSRSIAPTETPVLPPPQALFSSTTDDGLVQLSWRKPLLYRPSDGRSRGRLDIAPPITSQKILGFLVEYRWTDVSQSDPEERSKRSKRAAKMPQRGEWDELATTYENITTVVVEPDNLYRDLMYEFRVLTVSENEYSPPSNPVSFSTKDLTAYPCYAGLLPSAPGFGHPMIAGILAAVILMIILIGFTLFWCCKRRKRRKMKKKGDVVALEGSSQGPRSSRAHQQMNGKVIANKQPIVVDLTNNGAGGYGTMERREYDTAASDDEVKTPFIRNNNNIEESDKVFTAFMTRHDGTMDADSRKETLSSDRSSVRLRRETAAKVLLEQYKRRSLTDQTYHRIHRDIPLRGGTRSASTSPERNISGRADNHNTTAPAVLEDPAGRKRIRLYSKPIDDAGSAQQRRMIVIKRKSHKKSSSEPAKKTSTGAPPSDSSESPVFGVVGTIKHSSTNSLDNVGPQTSSPIRRGRRSSPFHERRQGYNRDDIILRSPECISPPRDPIFTSSPKDNSSPEVSPNRVIARRTVEYDPNADPVISPRPYTGSPTRRHDRHWQKSNSLTNEQRKALQPIRTRSESHRNFHQHSPYVEGSHHEPYDRGRSQHYFQNPAYQMILRGQTGTRYSYAQLPRGPSLAPHHHGQYHPSPPVHNASRSRASYSVGHHQPLAPYSPSKVYEQPHPAPHMRPSTSASHSTPPSSPGQRPPTSTCEIDCSNSDIEVRFVKNANGDGYSPVMSRERSGRGGMVNVNSSEQTPTKVTALNAGSVATPSSGNSGYPRNISTAEAENLDLPRRSPQKVLSPTKKFFSQPLGQSPSGKNFEQPQSDVKNRPRYLLSPPGSKTSSPLRHIRLKSDDNKDYPPTSPPLAAIGSSDYGSQDTSNSSTSPLTTNSQGAISPMHLRFPSTTQDRPPRRDNSSVEDNYEWDSEIAMESEILEALRHFGTLKKSGPVSDELLDELHKITKNTENLPERQRAQSADILDSHTSRDDHSEEEAPLQSASPGPNYSKESMARRCAALRAEFLHYQQLQQLDEDGVT